VPLHDNVEKFCTSGQTTDDNMANAHYMLDTSGYKYTRSVCVTLIAFLLQQWWQERTSVLRYTHIACFFAIMQHNLVGEMESW